jgi:response regulator NasT
VPAPQIEVGEVGPVTAREQPDVAFVGLGDSSEHALELIGQIVHEAACPVVALLHAPDPGFVVEAGKRGVFAYITDGDPQEWQNSIEIVLRRFAEYRDLEGAFKRRAITERAKGVLMERHGIDEESIPDAPRACPPDADQTRRHGAVNRRRAPSAPEAALPGSGPAARAKSEDHARRDSQQPPEDGRREDDPDQRLPRRADDPAHLDAACVCNRERDYDDNKQDESGGPRIEPGAVRMPPKALAAKLPPRRLLLRCLLLRSGLRLHITPSRRQVASENTSQTRGLARGLGSGDTGNRRGLPRGRLRGYRRARDAITLRAIARSSLNSYGFCRNAATPRPVSS